MKTLKEITLNEVVNAIKVKETSKEQMKLINSNAEHNINYIDKRKIYDKHSDNKHKDKDKEKSN